MNQGIVWAFMGTGFTFLMTAFGASVVFILKNDMQIAPYRIRIRSFGRLRGISKQYSINC